MVCFISSVVAQTAPGWDISPDWTFPTSYTITASAGSGGIISPSGAVSVSTGASQTFIFYPNAGYGVSNIIIDGSTQPAASSYTFTNVTSSHTITVNFAIATYTITASAGTGCEITPSGTISANYGDTLSFSYAAQSGYIISQVLVDGSAAAISSPTGTYQFPSITANHTIAVSAAVAPTPTPAPTSPSPTPTSNPNPHNHPTQTLNLYMRSDTYNFSDISAYGLDTDYNNTYVSIPITSATTNATITYGYRIYLAASSSSYQELTAGTPAAQINLNTNYTGQISSSYTIPDTTVIMGEQAIKIDVYAKVDSGDWTIQASYITNPLLTQELMPATWSFTLNLAMTQTTGNTTCTLTFGDSSHRSTVTGVVIVEPNYTDVQGWQWLNGDIIGLILGSYLHLLGPTFYILIYVAIFGGLWLRHRSLNPIVYLAIVLGGGFGMGAFMLLPIWAAIPLSVFIILALMALIWKVIR